MSLTLNQQLCINCGQCVSTCPVSILVKRSDIVSVKNKRLHSCLHCGHCVAICPKSALTLDLVDPDNLQKVKKAPLSDLQRSMLFKSRRSIRFYKEQPVSREILLRALDETRYAPTAINSQQVEWIFIEGKKELYNLSAKVAEWARTIPGRYSKIAARFDAGDDPILRKAPGVILAHAHAASAWGAQDCSAAVSYLELSLHSQGIGTCWAGFVISAANHGADLGLPIPEDRKLYAGLMIGYPAIHYMWIPPRKPLQLTIISPSETNSSLNT